MISLILFYVSWYLVIGLVSAWLINQVIMYTQTSEPYTAGEIAFAIIFWPINVSVFICALIISLFR
jgi:hypothetical protein